MTSPGGGAKPPKPPRAHAARPTTAAEAAASPAPSPNPNAQTRLQGGGRAANMGRMVRPEVQLHPPRTPAPLEPAVTLLLLRDSPQGLQVLMTRRNPNARFAPGAHVFPGGAIDPADALATAWCTPRPQQDAAQCTVAAAALRECFEEVGVALARTADGRWATADDVAALDRSAPLWSQPAAQALRWAVGAVWPVAHWPGTRSPRSDSVLSGAGTSSRHGHGRRRNVNTKVRLRG